MLDEALVDVLQPANKGLVEKGEHDRRTNYYVLTQRGRREIEARREWEDGYLEPELSV